MSEHFTEYFENCQDSQDEYFVHEETLIKSTYFKNPILIFFKPIHYNADRKHILKSSLQESEFY